MNTVSLLLSHLIPIIITLVVIFAIYMVYHWRHVFHFIVLVANANDEEGEVALAKHLANKTGGPRIHVSSTWESFLPAARQLHQLFQNKKQSLADKA